MSQRGNIDVGDIGSVSHLRAEFKAESDRLIEMLLLVSESPSIRGHLSCLRVM